MSARNFSCPETKEPCVNPDCTLERCSEQARLEVEANQKEAEKERRLHHAKVAEVMQPLIKRLKEKRN